MTSISVIPLVFFLCFSLLLFALFIYIKFEKFNKKTTCKFLLIKNYLKVCDF